MFLFLFGNFFLCFFKDCFHLFFFFLFLREREHEIERAGRYKDTEDLREIEGGTQCDQMIKIYCMEKF